MSLSSYIREVTSTRRQVHQVTHVTDAGNTIVMHEGSRADCERAKTEFQKVRPGRYAVRVSEATR